ncbi:MAG: peptide chain release factor N(5)-glutamine methyltransferase [Proteobacteria bacterium]|nr:peptide chain release factor N(5)-glutamine methyltransferase [Pseudomonadota bacterium]
MKNLFRDDNRSWTIRKIIESSVSCFEKNGIDSPRITAETLLVHVLNIRKLDLYLEQDRLLSETEISDYNRLVYRRLEREPLAYIVGEKGFWSLSFDVNRDVLIPRPDTECLVETALAVIPEKKKGDSACRILDLGTGSGAIILSLAKERPGHAFFAVDMSVGAVCLASKNARRNFLEGKVSFFAGYWLDAIKNDHFLFDVIVSNPPYIRTQDIKTLQPEIHQFEPFLALDGDEDGLKAIRHIVNDAVSYLISGGRLILEAGDDQKKDLVEIIEKNGKYRHISFHRDLTGKTRVVQMEKI